MAPNPPDQVADPPNGTAGPVGDAALPISAVARRTGIPPDTLRVWQRRYGLGPSGTRPEVTAATRPPTWSGCGPCSC